MIVDKNEVVHRSSPFHRPFLSPTQGFIEQQSSFGFLEILLSSHLDSFYARGRPFFIVSQNLNKILWIDQRFVKAFGYNNFFDALGGCSNFCKGTKAQLHFGVKKAESFQLDSEFGYQEFFAHRISLNEHESAILIVPVSHFEGQDVNELILSGLEVDGLKAVILSAEGEILAQNADFEETPFLAEKLAVIAASGKPLITELIIQDNKAYRLVYFALKHKPQRYLVMILQEEYCQKLLGSFNTDHADKGELFPFFPNKDNLSLNESDNLQDRIFDDRHFVELAENLEFISIPRKKNDRQISAVILPARQVTKKEEAAKTDFLISGYKPISKRQNKIFKHNDYHGNQQEEFLPDFFVDRTISPLACPLMQIVSMPHLSNYQIIEPQYAANSIEKAEDKPAIEKKESALLLDRRGAIKDINDLGALFLGNSPGALKGKNFFDYIARDDHHIILEKLRLLKADGTQQGKVVLDGIVMLKYGILSVKASLVFVPLKEQEAIGVIIREPLASPHQEVCEEENCTIIEPCPSSDKEKVVSSTVEPTQTLYAFETALETLKSKATEKNIVLQKAVAENLKDSVFEIEEIKKIFYDLLLMAIEASKIGGRIVVSAENKSKAILLRISDNGEGLTASAIKILSLTGADLAQNLESFDTEQQQRLKLFAKVKQIVESCGGQFTILSRAKEGTTLSLLLPMN